MFPTLLLLDPHGQRDKEGKVGGKKSKKKNTFRQNLKEIQKRKSWKNLFL
ncbi:MAG: hypothetical protein CM15mV125_040 [uncultured marine virus]|nr:MAG: hypothetical protein CM15mV125_040 [uncultured marine virus]